METEGPFIKVPIECVSQVFRKTRKTVRDLNIVEGLAFIFSDGCVVHKPFRKSGKQKPESARQMHGNVMPEYGHCLCGRGLAELAQSNISFENMREIIKGVYKQG